jgi:hypothetical protein
MATLLTIAAVIGFSAYQQVYPPAPRFANDRALQDSLLGKSEAEVTRRIGSPDTIRQPSDSQTYLEWCYDDTHNLLPCSTRNQKRIEVTIRFESDRVTRISFCDHQKVWEVSSLDVQDVPAKD